jgi:hypothetical protein
MKRLVTITLAFAALLAAAPAAANEVCTPVAPWTRTWTDGYTSTYTITAPDCVYLTVPFDVTITATDSNPDLAESMVGGVWSVLDNGVVAEQGSTITLTAGTWSRTFTWTYTGTAVNHTIQFSFKDFGEFGWSFHGVDANVIGAVTVDPLPPVDPPPPPPPVEPPATDPSTDPAPTEDPPTGCATGGFDAGLLSLLAIGLAAARRRR